MDAKIGTNKRGTELVVSFANGRVSFSSESKLLFTAKPHLLVEEIINAVAPFDNKFKRWKQLLQRGVELPKELE